MAKSLKKQIEERERRVQKLSELADVLGKGRHNLRKGNLFVRYDEGTDERDHWDWVESYDHRDLDVRYENKKVLSVIGIETIIIKYYNPGVWEKQYIELLSSPEKIAAGKRGYITHERKLESDKCLKDRAKKVGL